LRILLLDIETAPNLAYVWGLWKQNIHPQAIAENGYVLCWAAKWHGEKTMYFDSVMQSSRKKMLNGIHKLLQEADAVVHYNGKKFDMPTLNKEFLLEDMGPPSPYKQIDLLQITRSTFRFSSNKLDFVAKTIGLGAKTKHAGYQLWLDCMAKDPTAWKKMEKYNKKKLYNKLLPWVRSHPNRHLYDEGIGCPRCGSKKDQSRGEAHTIAVTYRRYQCNKCRGWFKGAKSPRHEKAEFTSIS